VYKCRDLEDQPGIDYSKVQRWFTPLRVQRMGVLDSRCILDFDLISFPVNVSNLHWTTVLLYTKQRRVHVLDSMTMAEVCIGLLYHVFFTISLII